METNYCVYKHTSPSGKVYIGITKNISQRWANGLGYRKNPLFMRAIEKYGWDNIEHEILEVGLDVEAAKEREKYYIGEYRSNERAYGYNLTAGGDGCNGSPRSERTKAILRVKCRGWHHTESAKAEISRRSKENWNREEYRNAVIEKRMGANNLNYGKKLSEEKLSRFNFKGHTHTAEWFEWAREHFSGEGNPNYGKKMSEEQLAAMSERTKKQMKDPAVREHLRNCFERKVVDQYDMSGEFIAQYDGLHEAQRETGVLASNISLCCRGTRKSAGGFIWKYAS